MSSQDFPDYKIILHKEEPTQSEKLILNDVNCNITLLASDFFSAGPQKPLNLTATDVRLTEVDLDWDKPPTTYDDFTVYVEEVSSGNVIQTIENIIGTSTTISGLSAETEYEFYVTSIRNNLESPHSNHVTITTDIPINLTTVYYSASGVNDKVFTTPYSGFSETEIADLAQGDPIRWVKLDKINDYIAVSGGGSFPGIYTSPLSSISFTDITPGSSFNWETAADFDEVNQRIYCCQTNERLYVRDYDGANQQTISLFSQDYRPSGCIQIDFDDDRIILATSGSAPHRTWSIDLNDPTGDQIQIITDNTIFCVDEINNIIYYKDPNDNTKIRSIDYAGNNDSAYLDIGETIRDIKWIKKEPDIFFISTATGLYKINIATAAKSQVLSTTRINNFDII